jgi:hypothetical protein
MQAVLTRLSNTPSTSVALALAAFLGACASNKPNTESAVSAKTPVATEAAKVSDNHSLPEAYFLNRGVESGIKQLVFVQDYGQPLFALGEKSGQFYRFEASSGKFVGTFDAKGDKAFALKSLFRAYSKFIYVLDPANQRIQMWKQDFATQAFGDVPFTVVKNPVAFEISGVADGNNVKLNFIDDTDGKRTLVQTEMALGFTRETSNFVAKDITFSTPKVVTLPASVKAGDTAALRTDSINNQLWVASGKEVFVLNLDGSASNVAPMSFETSVYAMDVMACKRGEQLGYWMIGTQAKAPGEAAPFKIIDRGTLKPAGGFSTPLVKAPTDMLFRTESIGLFPNGAVFVATEGTGVVSVDWAKIAEVNGLRKNCF